MPKGKNININYTSRDFDSIKRDLEEYAKRHYPDTYKDFSALSVNSLILDSVAYVGDILSYYVDYQANESFLDTSIERANIRKISRSLGYKFSGKPNAYGQVALFCLIPADEDGIAPNASYYPIIKRGTSFTNANGATYTLTEDVRFDSDTTEVVAARFDSTSGQTTFFAAKNYGQVVSGVFQQSTADLTNSTFRKFRKIKVGDVNTSEVVSIKDSDGNEYFEVDNLSQEVVFKEVTNKSAASDGVRSIMKPFIATRRFIVEQDDTGTYVQFGFGDESNEPEGLADPSKLAIKMHGKREISSLTFDPTQLLGTSKLGFSPQNTVLTIVTKVNDSANINSAVDSLRTIKFRNIDFDNIQALSAPLVRQVLNSIEVTNEEPIIGGDSTMTNEEIKQNAKTYYASQSRAVTKQDYESLVYSMPAKFGKIKRVNVVNDPSSTNRRIAMYLISVDKNGRLTTANSRIKLNVKNWLSSYQSLNDRVDIFDAKIVNFGIDFKITVDERYSQYDIVGRCVEKLKQEYSNQLYIGEPVSITNLYSVLGKVEGVADVKNVNVIPKKGTNYSATRFNFDEMKSTDGTFIKTPKNVIMELKFPNADIRGRIA
tara:strand:- start:8671 stop:10470 length:1800 start_codon:yes stop_codon:yes gene_type:complete